MILKTHQVKMYKKGTKLRLGERFKMLRILLMFVFYYKFTKTCYLQVFRKYLKDI